MLVSTDHTEGFGEGVTGSLVERMGLFTIIVLGELVVGVVGGISDAEHRDVTTVATGILGLTIAMGIWWNYFDMLGRRVPGQRGHRLASWLYAHLPLAMAIAASGAAMVSIIEHAHDSRTPGPTAWLLTGSVAVTLGAVSIACTALPVDEFPSGMQRWIGPTLGIAAAVDHRDRRVPSRPDRAPLLRLGGAAPGVARVVRRLPRTRWRPRRGELPTRPRPRCPLELGPPVTGQLEHAIEHRVDHLTQRGIGVCPSSRRARAHMTPVAKPVVEERRSGSPGPVAGATGGHRPLAQRRSSAYIQGRVRQCRAVDLRAELGGEHLGVRGADDDSPVSPTCAWRRCTGRCAT